jgi:AcrR family transcriptional regulator
MQRRPEFAGQTPTQPRAQRTVADLFEATAQLLDTDAPERLTTNHVAERAGYSIGTLYRYFPCKLALLRGMASREILTQQAAVQVALKGLSSPVRNELVVRIFVRAALKPFAGRHRVHAGVMRLLATAAEQSETSEAPASVTPQRLSEALFSAPQGLLPEISSETKFTMIHAVTGAVEAALRSKPELMTSRDFEDQLVGLVLYFLNTEQRCAQPDRL